MRLLRTFAFAVLPFALLLGLARSRLAGAGGLKPLQEMSEFQKAFGCKPGSPMVRRNTCRVW